MSHETHHSHTSDKSPKTSYTSAFWFVVILVGLFIGAVNFVNVMGHDEGHEAGGHEATEHTTGPVGGETMGTEAHGAPMAADTAQHVTPAVADTAVHTEAHTEAH